MSGFEGRNGGFLFGDVAWFGVAWVGVVLQWRGMMEWDDPMMEGRTKRIFLISSEIKFVIECLFSILGFVETHNYDG